MRRSLLLLALAGCAASGGGDRDAAWRAHVLWKGETKIESVTVGDADPAHPGLEGVACGEDGSAFLVAWPEARVIYRHGARLTGAHVADVDPAVPGAEIYVGGSRPGGEGGAVVQLCVRPDGVGARTVLETDGFVHAMRRLPPGNGRPASLIVITYSGKVLEALPRPAGAPWTSRLLHQEPAEVGEEGLKLKDVAVGPLGGGSPRQILVAAKSGRCLRIDPDGAGPAELCHCEPEGVARLSRIREGKICMACNDGRVLELSREGGAWGVRTLYREVDELRGAVLGKFPFGGEEASLAIYGYSGFCRLLVARGAAWDSRTLFQDSGRGHWLAAGDLVPGNGADELLLASYSGRIILLSRETTDRTGRTSP